MKKLSRVVLLFLGVSLGTAAAAEKAWYGFHIKPETFGFPLNPIVRSVVIDKVKANSPAAAQNIRVGDEIVEAEGKAVPGTRVLQLWPLLSRRPGELLRLRLRRADGRTYSVAVQGIRKPAPKERTPSN